jgi:sulfonate transport system substrate-binding protein
MYKQTTQRTPLVALLIVLGGLVAVLAISCGGDDGASGAGSPAVPAASAAGDIDGTPAGKVTLRLGYFPNVTHAQALVGVKDGWFQRALGANVKLEAKTFNAGPAAIEAMFAGEIDATYVGPNPAINGYVQSGGKEVRIVSGAASAGALFIVRPGANINSPADMANKKLATPQLGNTQDVALRSYLKANGLKTKDDGGNVTVLPTANADTLNLFKQGLIDGAWVPEPWASRLVLEAGGKVFVNEKDIWPNGQFVTTQLIVRTGFLKDHPDAVQALVKANVDVTDWINQHAEDAKKSVNDAIEQLTTARLTQDTMDAVWKNLQFTWDPIASSLRKSADDAFALGFLEEKPNLANIYDLSLLYKVLAARGQPPVSQ